MSPGFRELENITADLGIEAWGSNLQEAFTAAGEALAALLSDLPPDSARSTTRITVHSPTREGLLVVFLNEIIYREETENFLPGRISHLEIREDSLTALLKGTTYDPQKHHLNAHIKAATYHGLEIVEEKDEVRIRVIFDV